MWLNRFTSVEVIKMWYTDIYSNIIVYQNYIRTSIKVGCATRSLYASSGPKTEGVPNNNQRGRNSAFGYSASLVSCRLLVAGSCPNVSKNFSIYFFSVYSCASQLNNAITNDIKRDIT